MIQEFLSTLNWVDYLIAFLLLFFLVIGIKRGFIGGIFMLAGSVAASVVSLHYYPQAASLLSEKSGIPLDFCKFISILVMAPVIIFLFLFFKKVLDLLVKTEAKKILNQLGGLIIGCSQGLLLTSLVLITLFLSTLPKAEEGVLNSRFAGFFIKIAPRIYMITWDKFMQKLAPSEQFNQEVPEMLQFFSTESKED